MGVGRTPIDPFGNIFHTLDIVTSDRLLQQLKPHATVAGLPLPYASYARFE